MEQKKLDDSFLQAVAQGDIEKAIQALTEGANLNALSTKGNNALYVSATRGYEDMFSWLLEVKQKNISLDLNSLNNSQETLLYNLLREKVSISMLERLLAAGADVNKSNADGVTPLLQACSENDASIVKLLLQYGADPNAPTRDNTTTPVLMSIAEGSFDILKVLCEHGGNLNAVDMQGRNALITALFRPVAFMKKAEKIEHKKMIDYLIDSNIDLNYTAPSGASALWLAAYLNMDKAALSMIEKGVDVDRWHEMGADGGKLSVLHIACKIGNEQLVQALLEKGAALSVPDEKGNNAEAYGFQFPALRPLLLEHGADINSTLTVANDQRSISVPLLSTLIAEGEESFPMVEELISRGALVERSSPNFDKVDPLLLAITQGDERLVSLLLTAPSVNISKRLYLTEEGIRGRDMGYLDVLASGISSQKINSIMEQKKMLQTLLDAKKENDKNNITSSIIDEQGFEKIAQIKEKIQDLEAGLEQSKEKIFHLLLQAGVSLESVDKGGKTPIFYCSDDTQAKLFQKAGADIYKVDNEGNNPFTHSIVTGNFSLIDFYKKQYGSTQNLDNMLYRLAFTEVHSYQAQTKFVQGLLYYVGGEALVKQAKENKGEDGILTKDVPQVHYQDEDGNNALLVACANNSPFLVSLLYSLGADLNKANHLGETPIMHAIGTGNSQMVEFLIKRGADCSARTLEGKSVHDFAYEGDDPVIVRAVAKAQASSADNSREENYSAALEAQAPDKTKRNKP